MEPLKHMGLQGLIRAARGLERADLVIKNARVVNVFSGELLKSSVALYGGRIAAFEDSPSRRVIDLKGMYLAPGFIDGHIHIESTMLTPPEFARAVLPRGTTTVVSDPHEIANVMGRRGISYMLDSTKDIPFDVFLMLPSCVPSTGLETGGAHLGTKDLRPFLKSPRVIGLAEVMDYIGVIGGKKSLLSKIKILGHRLVDGHSPGLSGRELDAYISSGIYSDHECTDIKEAGEKLRKGMYIMIRQGTTEKNLDELLPLVGKENSRRFILVSDDIHPMDLEKGHMDRTLRRAVALGLDPVTALRLCTLNPCEYFGLKGFGAVAPGYFADLVVLEDLRGFNVRMTIKRGRIVAKDDRTIPGAVAVRRPMNADSVNIGWKTMKDIKVRAKAPVIKVMEVVPGQILTRLVLLRATVRSGLVVQDVSRDILKAVVVERHRATGRRGVAFVRGFGLKRGAIASTVAHDAHNIVAVGAEDRDIITAVKAIEGMGGGLVAVERGKIVSSLRLPVAGLMTPRPLGAVAEKVRSLIDATRRLGSGLEDPFMTMSFLALPVIPVLRVTDRGLVDARTRRFTSLFAAPRSEDRVSG